MEKISVTIDVIKDKTRLWGAGNIKTGLLVGCEVAKKTELGLLVFLSVSLSLHFGLVIQCFV